MIRVGTLKFLLQIAYKFSQLCGLVPFHYSEGSSSYVSGWYDQIWPATAYLSFAYFYPTSGLSVISVLNPLVVVAFFYMTVTTISVIFLVQAINARKICTLLNDIAALNSELFKREQNLVGKSYWPYVSLALAKIILVNFVAQCAVIYCCTTLAIMLTGKGDFFVVFLISWAYCLQTIVPNMFYVGVLGASFHYEQINKEIAVVLREAKLLSFGQHDFTSNELKEKFLELSGRLNCLASLHSRLFHLVTRANETCSLQLLVSTANFVGILLIETFFAYLFIAESFLTSQPVNVWLMLFILIYCGAIFMELFMLSTACLRVKNEFKNSANHLHIAFFSNIDNKFKKSIEMFSIQMLNQDLSITAYGLFKIDYTLVFSVVASTASYLIILIQFQLTRSKSEYRPSDEKTVIRSV